MENAIVKYETPNGAMVELTADTVTKMLVHGNKQLTDKEVGLFINLCRYQRLNPFTGEAYVMKYGDDMQIVVGYNAFKRRAEENPNFIGYHSGIVVQRGSEIIAKEGSCLYPGEVLVGGWCRVRYTRNKHETDMYKEVGLKEYSTGKALWVSKPCTMIEKVAVSQALRSTFPTDYNGLYTPEEMGVQDEQPPKERVMVAAEEMPTKEELMAMFARANDVYGEAERNTYIKMHMKAAGCQDENTRNITKTQLAEIMELIQMDADDKITAEVSVE